ncbi:hypothetical protein LEP1GSC052_4037 [Leptospira kmetyi serovar Malaysia str. Bejo-Iso9]|nr:hypothetical protein LEP1GSC052_4037 [Leptospira kmetyi serovar Malaysia str. Bejo-Iso9]
MCLRIETARIGAKRNSQLLPRGATSIASLFIEKGPASGSPACRAFEFKKWNILKT